MTVAHASIPQQGQDQGISTILFSPSLGCHLHPTSSLSIWEPQSPPWKQGSWIMVVFKPCFARAPSNRKSREDGSHPTPFHPLTAAPVYSFSITGCNSLFYKNPSLANLKKEKKRKESFSHPRLQRYQLNAMWAGLHPAKERGHEWKNW